MDAASETKLSQVAPELAARVRAMAATLSARGITIRVISGFRSYASQSALYAARARNPNPVAAPGTSKHESGNAVDLSVVGGTWAQVGAAGEALGLRWGGRFSKPDPGHFELASGAARSDASMLPNISMLPDADVLLEGENAPYIIAGIFALLLIVVARRR